MNDDMYCCPGWDQAIADEISSIPESKYMLSATLNEPDPSSIQTDKIKNWLKKKFIY